MDFLDEKKVIIMQIQNIETSLWSLANEEGKSSIPILIMEMKRLIKLELNEFDELSNDVNLKSGLFQKSSLVMKFEGDLRNLDFLLKEQLNKFENISEISIDELKKILNAGGNYFSKASILIKDMFSLISGEDGSISNNISNGENNVSLNLEDNSKKNKIDLGVRDYENKKLSENLDLISKELFEEKPVVRRFNLDEKNQLIMDNKTNFEWDLDFNKNGEMTLNEAINFLKNKENSWHLPSSDDFKTLSDDGNYPSVINLHVAGFKNFGGFYWTSDSLDLENALRVHFASGTDGFSDRNSKFNVVCLRKK